MHKRVTCKIPSNKSNILTYYFDDYSNKFVRSGAAHSRSCFAYSNFITNKPVFVKNMFSRHIFTEKMYKIPNAKKVTDSNYLE